MLKCNKCATLYEYQAAIKSTKPLSFVPWNMADPLSYRSGQNKKSKIIIKNCQGEEKHIDQDILKKYDIMCQDCYVQFQEVMLLDICLICDIKRQVVEIHKQ